METLVEVVQHPERGAGYALIRFWDQTEAPKQARLSFRPLEGAPPPGWPQGLVTALDVRLEEGVLEVAVGPEAVDRLPADVPIAIHLIEPRLQGECFWPALVPSGALEAAAGKLVRPVSEAKAKELDDLKTAERREEIRPLSPPQEEKETPSPPAAPPVAEIRRPPPETSVEPLLPTPEPPPQTPASQNIVQPVRLASETPPSASAASEGEGWNRKIPAILAGVALFLMGLGAGHFFTKTTQPYPKVEAGGSDSALVEALLTELVGDQETQADYESVFKGASRHWRDKAQSMVRRAGDPDEITKNYRWAIRAALGQSQVPALVEELRRDVPGLDQRLRRILLALSVAGGNPQALCDLAADLEGADQEAATRLRARYAEIARPQSCPHP